MLAIWYGCDTTLFEYDFDTLIWVTDKMPYSFLESLYSKGYRGQQFRLVMTDTNFTDHIAVVYSKKKVRPILARYVYLGVTLIHICSWVSNLKPTEIVTNICLPKLKVSQKRIGYMSLMSQIGSTAHTSQRRR